MSEETTVKEKEETPFEWTMELMAHLLESCIADDSRTVLRPVISKKDEGPFFQPLATFTCYSLFCKRAFKDGLPPDNFSIEEYERKLKELLPPGF